MPIAVHAPSNVHVSFGNWNIMYNVAPAPRIGTNGTSGVRNGPFELRRTGTEHPHTDAHRRERGQRTTGDQLTEQSQREESGDDDGNGTDDPRGRRRRLIDRVHTAEDLRQQAVTRHGVENARLTHEHHQHHRREARRGADVHEFSSHLSCGTAPIATDTGCGTPSCW